MRYVLADLEASVPDADALADDVHVLESCTEILRKTTEEK